MTRKKSKSTTFSAPFLYSSLASGTKISYLWISLSVKTTYIDNKYDLYSIACVNGSSIIEGVDFTISYASDEKLDPFVYTCHFLCRIINYFVSDIYNAFQNTIMPNPEERIFSVYHNGYNLTKILLLPNLYFYICYFQYLKLISQTPLSKYMIYLKLL